MRQTSLKPVTAGDVSRHYTNVQTHSQQETLGAIAVEVLRSGHTLSRKAICLRLMACLEKASSPEDEQHLQELAGLLFSE